MHLNLGSSGAGVTKRKCLDFMTKGHMKLQDQLCQYRNPLRFRSETSVRWTCPRTTPSLRGQTFCFHSDEKSLWHWWYTIPGHCIIHALQGWSLGLQNKKGMLERIKVITACKLQEWRVLGAACLHIISGSRQEPLKFIKSKRKSFSPRFLSFHLKRRPLACNQISSGFFGLLIFAFRLLASINLHRPETSVALSVFLSYMQGTPINFLM